MGDVLITENFEERTFVSFISFFDKVHTDKVMFDEYIYIYTAFI